MSWLRTGGRLAAIAACAAPATPTLDCGALGTAGLVGVRTANPAHSTMHDVLLAGRSLLAPDSSAGRQALLTARSRPILLNCNQIKFAASRVVHQALAQRQSVGATLTELSADLKQIIRSG